jgi:hypothetical protein
MRKVTVAYCLYELGCVPMIQPARRRRLQQRNVEVEVTDGRLTFAVAKDEPEIADDS